MELPVSGVLILMVIIAGGLVAIGAFIWAVRNEQFSDLDSGAYVIFDEEEPLGQMTDRTFASTGDKQGKHVKNKEQNEQ